MKFHHELHMLCACRSCSFSARNEVNSDHLILYLLTFSKQLFTIKIDRIIQEEEKMKPFIFAFEHCKIFLQKGAFVFNHECQRL